MRSSVMLSWADLSSMVAYGSVRHLRDAMDSTYRRLLSRYARIATREEPSNWSTAATSALTMPCMVRTRRVLRSSIMPTISSSAGATDSAAAVGVEQRLSDTMSQMDVSGSCPMPVTTGTGLAATARASASSL